MIKKPDEIKTILKTLTDAGYDVYCAGQCIVATELGEDPLDWDIYTDCPQDKVRQLFADGEPLGTRTTRLDYTTFVPSTHINEPDRYDGVIADVVTLKGKIENQLAESYDFTCEAVAEHPIKAFVDPYGGTKDSRIKRLRPVGDIDAAIRKNPLIIMKALRYVGLYNFDLSKDLYESILKNAELLQSADKEEILYEFYETINGNHAGKFLKMVKGLGVLPALIGNNTTPLPREKKDFETLCENIDKLKHIALRRMCLFYLCFDKKYKDAVQFLPHDEEDLDLLLSAKPLLPKLHFCSDDTSIKGFIYRTGWDKYNFMDKVAKAQVIVYDYSNQRCVGRDAILKEILLQHQPIFIEDLVIDADDIIEAGITDDPERAEALLDMLMDVVHKDMRNNERDKLLKLAKSYNKNKLKAAFRSVSWLR